MTDSDKIKYGRSINKICPYCQSNIKHGEDYTVCAECGTPHHRECWNENRGCTTFGCKENPGTKKASRNVVDIGNQTVEEVQQLLTQVEQNQPATISNRLINCPECNSLVDENSRFCKFCGYSFNDNQTPIRRNEFEKEYIKRYKQRVSLQRKGTFLTTGSIILILIILLLSGYFAYVKITEQENSPKEEIKRTVLDWKKAWEDKDLNKYQSYLADDYKYTSIEENNRKEMELSRADRVERIKWTFNRYDYIKIEFTKMKIEINANDSSKAIVKVSEKYESDKYGDEGDKTLYMERDTSGKWMIYKEVFEL